MSLCSNGIRTNHIEKRRTKNRTSGAAMIAQSRWMERDAVVITDSGGRITDCSPAAADLLGQCPHALPGSAVSSVIPSLPIMPETPNHNLAYASFHGADDIWVPHSARTAEGQPVAIDMTLTNARMGGASVIVMTLRPPVLDQQ